MSKAFTREDDQAPEPEFRPRITGVNLTGKTFLTASGARSLQAELDRLERSERPRLAAIAADPDAKRRLQILDARIVELRQILGTATVVPPPALPWDQVRFGASVTVLRHPGEAESYRIVGPAELDADRGWVSAASPIGRALLNARLGQRLRFRSPSGDVELEVKHIHYE